MRGVIRKRTVNEFGLRSKRYEMFKAGLGTFLHQLPPAGIWPLPEGRALSLRAELHDGPTDDP
ncbi:hypothetical protein [Methyloferula stellata]|uniref:hypothetical protein n=1 Tax=Methyloferula stellata TaxID=876270 RepID=UPI001267F64D|nr:hypothetical protein [Methyloferula stellata]